jgi:hypothetical protein
LLKANIPFAIQAKETLIGTLVLRQVFSQSLLMLFLSFLHDEQKLISNLFTSIFRLKRCM